MNSIITKDGKHTCNMQYYEGMDSYYIIIDNNPSLQGSIPSDSYDKFVKDFEAGRVV